MPGRYSTEHVKRLIRKRGRQTGQRGLEEHAKSMFGKTKGLTAKQAADLTRAMMKKRLAVTPERKKEARLLLKANRSAPPPERKNFEQISKLTGLSKSELKKLNKEVRQGKSKVMRSDPSRKEVPGKLRQYLSKNPGASPKQAAQALGISVKQMQRILPQYRTSFASERKKAKNEAIKRLDRETGGSLSTKQLAQKLGLKESYVSANRPRRGRGSGHAARREKSASRFLGIIGLISTLNMKRVSLDTLRRITNASRPTAYEALKQLKRSGLVKEVEQGEYMITQKGIGYRNMTGRTPGNTLANIKRMKRRELEGLFNTIREVERTVPRENISPNRLTKIKQRIKTEIADRVIGSK